MMRSLLSCERGNSFIEMALALPVLLSLLVGMVDISRGISEKLQITQIAQRAVERIQRSNFQPSDMPGLETEAEGAAGAGSDATVSAWLECGSSTTQLAYTSSCTPGEAYARYVAVSIDRPFMPYFGSQYFPGANADGSFTLTGTAGVRVQ